MSTIGNLVVNLTAGTAGFTAGMKRATRELKNFEATAKGIQSTMAAFGVALAPVAALEGLREMATTGAEAIDRLNDLSERVKSTADDLNALEYAAKLDGSSFEEMDKGLQKLMVSVGQAERGNQKTAQAFEQLGLNANRLAQLGGAGAFKEVAQQISQIEDPAKRADIAVALMGKSAMNLMNVLLEGKGGLAEMQKDLHALGAPIDDSSTKQVAAMMDSLDRLKTFVVETGKQIATGLAGMGLSFDTPIKAVKHLEIEILTLAQYATRYIKFVLEAMAYLPDWLGGSKANNAAKAAGEIADAMATVADDLAKDIDRINDIAARPPAAKPLVAEQEDIETTQREAVKATAKITEEMKQQRKISDMLTDLAKQRDQFGMDEAARRVDELKRAGADPYQIARARMIQAEIEGMETAKKHREEMDKQAKKAAEDRKRLEEQLDKHLTQEGRKRFEDTLNAAEKMRQRQLENEALFRAGKISGDTADRADAQAFFDFRKDSLDSNRAPKAIEQGTAAAFEAISEGRNDPLAKLSETQLKALNELQRLNETMRSDKELADNSQVVTIAP